MLGEEYQKEHKRVMFSQLQNLSPWNEDKQRMSVEAKKQVGLTCEISAEQARCHRWFVHAHFAEATSWNMEAVRQIWPEKKSKQ